MRLENICGQTYAINYPSAVGIYVLPNRECILIDSGASQAYAARTLKIIEQQSWKLIAIINTHSHGDHSGGINIFRTAAAAAYTPLYRSSLLEPSGPGCLLLISFGVYAGIQE